MNDIIKYNVSFDLTVPVMERVFSKYNANRQDIHDNFFYNRGAEQLMDIHKIAACFAKAIMEEAPVSFSIEENPPKHIKIINYMLAFHASVNLMDFFMIANYKNHKPEYYEKAINRKYVCFPKTTPGHDTYTIGRIKAMALNDIKERGFDLLAYADMIYWIEHYNRQIIEGKIFV